MQSEFREGDWVRHKKFPEPIRVIGIGSTIAVQFPNGEMRAFEPEELEKVKVQQSKVTLPERRQDRVPRSARGVVSLATSVGLICLIILVLAMIAARGTLNLR